jgi:anti-sigma28 factor (negative regulator of flagellin synthesis)
MISKVNAGNSAYMQQVASLDKKETQSVEKPKELDKVESLKQQIQSGEYKVDLTKTAKAMAEDLM